MTIVVARIGLDFADFAFDPALGLECGLTLGPRSLFAGAGRPVTIEDQVFTLSSGRLGSGQAVKFGFGGFEATLGGTGLRLDGLGRLADGSVNKLVVGTEFTVAGFAVDAVRPLSAAASDAVADDQSLLLQMLSGDDLLLLGATDDAMRGSAGDDLLFGGDGVNILGGGTGYDTMAGGADVDCFIIGHCQQIDSVQDFDPDGELILIESGARTFADVSITQDGRDALVGVFHVTMRLVGVDIDDPASDDFRFIGPKDMPDFVRGVIYFTNYIG